MNEEKKRALERNLTKVCLIRGLIGSFLLVVPTIVLFFQSHGLSMRQFAELEAIHFGLVVALLEIPGGYFADILGRRRALMIGLFTMGLGDLWYAFSVDFQDFLVGEYIFAVGIAFSSGADRALFYDTLKELGRESEAKRLWKRAAIAFHLSGAVAALIGVWLRQIEVQLPFLVAAVLMISAGVVAATLHEPHRGHSSALGGHIRELRGVMRDYIWRNSEVRWLILFCASIMAFANCAFWLYQPFMQFVGIPSIWFGWIFAGLNLIAGIVAIRADWLGERVRGTASFLLVSGVLGAAILTLALYASPLAVVACAFVQFVWAYREIVLRELLDLKIPSRSRTTIISIESMIFRLILILVMVPTFWLVDAAQSVQTGLSWLGVALIVVAVLFLWRRPDEGIVARPQEA